MPRVEHSELVLLWIHVASGLHLTVDQSVQLASGSLSGEMTNVP
jgi:hypothetical protein